MANNTMCGLALPGRQHLSNPQHEPGERVPGRALCAALPCHSTGHLSHPRHRRHRGVSALLALLLPLLALPALAQSEAPSTIDPALQRLALRLLSGKQGSIVVIEPQTGEVKCMASRTFAGGDTANLAVSRQYPPGSTFKVASALAMLSMGTLRPETAYPCSRGFWPAGDTHIGCHAHRTPLRLADAISQSCNAYFCRAFMHTLRSPRYRSRSAALTAWSTAVRSLGLGTKLGIDTTGEAPGLIPDTAYMRRAYHGRWNEQTLAWVGMGQGEVLTTPLQLCNLAATIANRGYYITPHLRRYPPAAPLHQRYAEKHVALPAPEHFQTVAEGMRRAIAAGTAKMINTRKYDICGKTGTAQHGGPADQDDHSAFIGFAPMQRPRIAVAVYVECGGWGAELAAPLAAIIIEQALTGQLSAETEKEAHAWEDYYVIP